jgi:hypothetical protein
MKTYVIWDGDGVKVGKATEIHSRLASLQTGNPNILRLLAWVDANVESEMQRALKEHRMHKKGPGREWFDGYECSRSLSELLVKHNFTFAEGWDAYRFAVLHNRSERRSGQAAPGHRARAHAHGLRRSGGVLYGLSEKYQTSLELLLEAEIEVAHSFLFRVVEPVYASRWLRIGMRLGICRVPSYGSLVMDIGKATEGALEHLRGRIAHREQMEMSGVKDFMEPPVPVDPRNGASV